MHDTQTTVKEILFQLHCGYATPEYLASFLGKFVRPFQGQGQLRLTSEALMLESKSFSLNIPVKMLVDISLKTLPRWAVPWGVNYLILKYQADGREKTIALYPKDWFEIDRSVKVWNDVLRETIAKNATLVQEPVSHRKPPSIIKILFLAANPTDAARLRLDEEIRVIDQSLLLAKYREQFDLVQQWAVRVSDLQGHLLRHKPDIVHFSGHGTNMSEIVLEDGSGNSHPVADVTLSNLFSILKDNIRCVVLNACYSEKQARALAGEIDCVVGMSKAMGDVSAISFAAAFYQALGYGKDIQTAFDLGCSQIHLENLGEQDTPKLLAVKNDPRDIAFVRDR